MGLFVVQEEKLKNKNNCMEEKSRLRVSICT